MAFIKFFPSSSVTYIGKSNVLQHGRTYTIESITIRGQILFLRLNYIEGSFDSRDFIGDKVYFNTEKIREEFIKKLPQQITPIKKHPFLNEL